VEQEQLSDLYGGKEVPGFGGEGRRWNLAELSWQF